MKTIELKYNEFLYIFKPICKFAYKSSVKNGIIYIRANSEKLGELGY